MLIQGGGYSGQTSKLRGELCCQREKEVEEKIEQPDRESSQTAKGNFFFLIDLRIRWQILGITVMGFGIYRLLRFLGDYTVCWVVSRIHGCWRTNPTFGLQLHKCRSSCYNWLFLPLYIRGHVDQDQTKIKKWTKTKMTFLDNRTILKIKRTLSLTLLIYLFSVVDIAVQVAVLCSLKSIFYFNC